jgi:hypothetical protein
MIAGHIKRLESLIGSVMQQVMQLPKPIRIKEWFPKENMVTVIISGDTIGDGGEVIKGKVGDTKFPLLLPGRGAEDIAPQPGESGMIFFIGSQYKKGFVMMGHEEGGDEAMSYVPIRGSWAVS